MIEGYNYTYMLDVNKINSDFVFHPREFGFLKFHDISSDVTLSHILSDGLTSISTAISNSGNGAFADGLIFAVVGAFGAFAFNIIQKLLEARSVRLTKSGEAILLLIKEFERISVKYWISSYVPDNADENCYIEINIKATLMTIDKNVNSMITNLPFKNRDVNTKKLKRFSSEIYDLASGGDFESTSRQADKTAAFAISKKCSEAKAVILELI